MAKYTTTIKNLIDSEFNFGLDTYPIFDEEYRETLNQTILNYYYVSEIGFETPGLFKQQLNATMCAIMPKYNAMFVAEQEILENPLGNVNLTESLERNVDIDGEFHGGSSGSNTGSSTNDMKNLYQDTPQGTLSSTDIDNQKYATNLTLNRNSVSNSNTANTTTNNYETRNTVEGYTKTLIGSNGRKTNAETYSKLISGFESVNMLIINELQDLFMGVL